MDAVGLPNLETIDINNNLLETLHLGELPKLEAVNLNNNQLLTLDLSGAPNVGTLLAMDNQLASLITNKDESVYLRNVNLSNNSLTTLDASNWVLITTLSIRNNQLTSIPEGITKYDHLLGLNLSGNMINLWSPENLNSHDQLIGRLNTSYLFDSQQTEQNHYPTVKQTIARQRLLPGGTSFTIPEGIFEDADGDMVSITLSSDDVTGSIIEIQGQTVVPVAPGKVTVTVTAVDAKGGNESTSFMVEVVDIQQKTIAELFPDPGLAASIAKWMGNGTTVVDHIDQSDLASTLAEKDGFLGIGGAEILDLSGLELFNGLAVKTFQVAGASGLSSLDVTGFTNLEVLNLVGNTQLASLNVSGLTKVTKLMATGNQLTELDVRGLTSLQTLSVDRNQLTAIPLGAADLNLKVLVISNNRINVMSAENEPVHQILIEKLNDYYVYDPQNVE